jgi:hypothetical protein
MQLNGRKPVPFTTIHDHGFATMFVNLRKPHTTGVNRGVTVQVGQQITGHQCWTWLTTAATAAVNQERSRTNSNPATVASLGAKHTAQGMAQKNLSATFSIQHPATDHFMTNITSSYELANRIRHSNQTRKQNHQKSRFELPLSVAHSKRSS